MTLFVQEAELVPTRRSLPPAMRCDSSLMRTRSTDNPSHPGNTSIRSVNPNRTVNCPQVCVHRLRSSGGALSPLDPGFELDRAAHDERFGVPDARPV